MMCWVSCPWVWVSRLGLVCVVLFVSGLGFRVRGLRIWCSLVVWFVAG